MGYNALTRACNEQIDGSSRLVSSLLVPPNSDEGCVNSSATVGTEPARI